MKRKLKIYSQSMSSYSSTYVPTILLKGKWLEEAGFKAGEYVEVITDSDKITLTKTAAPEPKKRKMSLEEKIEGLDEKQRKMISEMIDNL